MFYGCIMKAKITLQTLADATGKSVPQMSKVVNGKQDIPSFTDAVTIAKILTGKNIHTLDLLNDVIIWLPDGGTAEQRQSAFNSSK